MDRMTVSSRHGEYSVVANPGAAKELASVLATGSIERPSSVVTNSTVAPLWADSAAASIDAPLIELADGEQHKRWQTVEGLLAIWLEAGLHRRDTVAAVGGGVLTDTVGFAAAVYLRGISWVAVPTTLLAMVDASVGGKTGVNLDQGKNLVGAFWPPRLVAIDVNTLSTLPERELRAGMAEVVKTAWIGDHDLLSEITSGISAGFEDRTADDWQRLVMRCVAVKAQVVSEDEHESGLRASLNFGHTLGHALEAATSYRHFLHGEAVAWGLLAAARLGRRHGLLSEAAENKLARAVHASGPLPSLDGIDPNSLGSHIGRDKKKDAEGIAWVLPTDDGVAVGQRVETDEAIEVFRELQNAG